MQQREDRAGAHGTQGEVEGSELAQPGEKGVAETKPDSSEKCRAEAQDVMVTR